MTGLSAGTAAAAREGQTDLDDILRHDPPPFALVHRPEATGPDRLELLVGEVSTVGSLADLPLPSEAQGINESAGHELLAVVPYRQIGERGFAFREDHAPLLALSVRAQRNMSVAEVMRRIPDVPIQLTDATFDIDDERYAEVVRAVITKEIGRGEGSNFVINRSFVAGITNYSVASALAVFRRLLANEVGAYWTFLVHTGTETFVGATPERHVSLSGGIVMMNPISGTHRYPTTGPNLVDVLRFLDDRKETDELFMVVDEELKMMARMCGGGARALGPYLKEMAQLAHTEYLLEGRSSLDVRAILRETMFAPAVTGSPLQSACRVITRYESRGREYYAGVLALIGRDRLGERTLDASILIRAAHIKSDGRLRMGVGATLVRHSDPVAEVAETRAKAAGLLNALGVLDPSHTRDPILPGRAPASDRRFGVHAEVRRALASRNSTLAPFWLGHCEPLDHAGSPLTGVRVLVIDGEDTFTGMLGHQLRSLGLQVTIRRFDELLDLDGYQLVVVGPGPGDPSDLDDPKIATMRSIAERLIRHRKPFLAVCLGHQVVASVLGFPLVRRSVPNQGVQREIDLFGRRERVGFYNTFAVRSDRDQVFCEAVSAPVDVSRDPLTGEVHALRGPGVTSVQFHPESVLTQRGVHIINELLTSLRETVAA